MTNRAAAEPARANDAARRRAGGRVPAIAGNPPTAGGITVDGSTLRIPD